MAASAPTPHATGFPAEGRCGYYVAKKKRFCRMVAAAGRRFCGEHAGAAEEENARKRILCPLDPKHTVYEDQLAKHLRKCNSREKPKPDFFIQDINAGLKDETEIPEQLVPISSLPEEQLEILIKKLKKASEDAEEVHFILVEKVPTRFKVSDHGHTLCPDGLALPRRPEVDGKHRKKNSVFQRLQIDIQHLCLNRIPVLSRERLPVVGIGKHLCGAATDLALRCLVETYGARREEGNEEPSAKRIKNNKADKDLGAAAEVGGEGHVAEEWSPVAGIVVALCCHHRCDWRHYVGKDYFRARGLGALEFHYFQRMSSWATCGRRTAALEASSVPRTRDDESEDGEEHDGGGHRGPEDRAGTLPGFLPAEEKERLGRLCKLLIDQGRLEYLQRRGFRAALQRYADPGVSLENVLLTALPAQAPPADATA
ncbi:tRNA:m(4)X modification enzyme TRM13 homolog isoform X5 [Myotis lucifugus]|uniref:tRNA:m(4)X modification enzyme TRM13 homolog isoform X5 n=1 Tax=Myotis lucifugus TaxID=59463 RepID=UPI000CCC00A0|nr:tRNA:m(4)X modification enzyme TRM13 homolog isoform X5 [Myotis lucifugus]